MFLAWNSESQELFSVAVISDDATQNTSHGLHLVCTVFFDITVRTLILY